MPQTNGEIAARIRKLAKESGVTVKQTLDDCNINRNFLYDLEKGNSSPSANKLYRIAEYFGINVAKLLDSEEHDTAEVTELYKKLSPTKRAAVLKYMQELIE